MSIHEPIHGAGTAAPAERLPLISQCALSAADCDASLRCPAVQLCAAVPLVSEVELERSDWTGRCVAQCTPGMDDEFGCQWQMSTCPAGYKCIPCNELK